MNESMILSLAGLAATAWSLSIHDVGARALLSAVAIMLFIAAVMAWSMSGDAK